MRHSACTILLAAAAVFATPVFAQFYKPQPAFPAVKAEFPVSAVIPPDDSGRIFLVQQRGKVVILPKDEASGEVTPFLDFSSRSMEAKDGAFEEGLLGLAFHPKFAQNGKLYVYYSQQDPKRSIISELTVDPKNTGANPPYKERILLEVPQPFWNHNSGNLLFGPDGFLYIAFGDGGKRDDATRAAQNPFMLLGKILRIDVDRTQGSRPYGIPTDNPFVGKPGTREEIYALGLRNPWGLSFDAEGGFWCADVGQDIWEEIDLIEKGGNYGWSFREGASPFPLRTDAPPADAKFIDPVYEYNHALGISITGGFVYRGEALPKLKSAYIYGDWATGRIWALRYDKAGKKVISNDLLYEAALNEKGKAPIQPAAFCEDAKKEVLVLDWNGKIFRLTSN